MSSTTPLGGTYSAVQTRSGAQELSQSFSPITGPATTTFLFSASDPGGADDRSFNPAFRGSGFVSGSPQINLRVVDLDNNGDGDVQVFSGIAGSGGTWQTVLTNAVTFGSTTSFSLTINGYGTSFSYDLTVGSQSATGLSLVQNGPLSNFAQLSFVNSAMAAGSTVQIDNVAVVLTDAAPFRLKITLNTGNPGHYDFTWNSQLWKTYRLVSSTDLCTRPDFWPAWDGRTGIAGTGSPITLSNVPAGGDSRRFFAISEND